MGEVLRLELRRGVSAVPLARRAVVLAVLIGSLLGLPPVAAHADSDPASDVLLVQSAFFPYQPAVSPRLETTVNTLLARVAGAHVPLKVAIIGSPEDLGAVFDLFGHPQQYAEFLDREISFNTRQPLLVAMPAGFGLVAAGSVSAIAGVVVDSHHGSNGLARSAILAVAALARSRGHPVSVPRIPSGAASTHDGFPSTVLFALPLAMVLVVTLVSLRFRKPRAGR